MGVFWAEHKSNQSDCHLPFPFWTMWARTHINQWHSSALRDRDVILGCWILCLPSHNHQSHQQLCLTAYEKIQLHLTKVEEVECCCIPLCACRTQSMDQTWWVRKAFILINDGGMRVEKYVLNEESINDITCRGPPAAETICFLNLSCAVHCFAMSIR